MAFWLWFFDTSELHKKIVSIPKKLSSFSFVNNYNSVLSAKLNSQPVLPLSYKIPIDSRRQAFNLSCEFATATSVISYFTNNPDFSVSQELTAEKILINKVAISKNPNVGLRMGDTANLENLYFNLNKGFGGADYYGIHAPPFFDIFQNYKLISKPIYINNETIKSIQQAISSGHLIMAWIKIGYSKSVDDDLSYGKVRIVRGEHSVIINGYDEKGTIVMDPGIGMERHIDYASLFEASSSFSIPFLEIYKNLDNEKNDLIIGFDTPTEIDRSIPKIYIENGAGSVGVASQMRDILKDFGYTITGTSNADNFDYQDITIKTKKDFSDFIYILKRDINIASFAVATSSADLLDNNTEDIIIIVGR